MTTVALVLVTTGLLMSVVGSFAPVFLAEAYVVAVALAQPVGVALAVAGAVVVGQTVGKLVMLESARSAGRWSWLAGVRDRLARLRGRSPGGGRPDRWLRRRVAAVDRWTVAAMARPRAPLVVALSGAVGLPPLLVVTVYAARSAMRTRWFAAACAAGRGARMLTLALVPGVAGGLALV